MPAVHVWEQQSKASNTTDSGFFTFWRRKTEDGTPFSASQRSNSDAKSPLGWKSPTGVRSPTSVKSPCRARSPPPSSGTSSPLHTRAAIRSVKLSSSIDTGDVPDSDFAIVKVVMPLNKAIKVVVDVNAQIKVLEKMDSEQKEGPLSERRRRKQRETAEQLVQTLKSLYVLDVAERKTFQPLVDRVMDELVPFLEVSRTIEETPVISKVEGGRRNSVIRAAEKQHEMLEKVAQKLAALAPTPSQGSSSSSEEAVDSAILEHTDRRAAVTADAHFTLSPWNANPSLGCDLEAQSSGLRNSTSTVGENGSESLAAAPSALLPRSNSADSVFNPMSVNGSKTGLLPTLPRNNSADSLFSLASVNGSTTGLLPTLPRNNSADSLFNLESVSGSEAHRDVLAHSAWQHSLLAGLLEQQAGDESRSAAAHRETDPHSFWHSRLPRHDSAVSLFNALMADRGEGSSSLGVDSDADAEENEGGSFNFGSEAMLSRPGTASSGNASSTPSLFEALLAIQNPQAEVSSGALLPRSKSMPSTYSYFSDAPLASMQIPEQHVVVHGRDSA